MLKFTKFGIGIPLDPSFDFYRTKILAEANQWLIDNFDDSFASASPCDLSEDFYDYYWVQWGELDKYAGLAEERREMFTRIRHFKEDVLEYFWNEEACLTYRESFHHLFPVKYIRKMCTKHIGGYSNKKALLLGCGTGESILAFESLGIYAEAIEINKYAFMYANQLALPRMRYGDFLTDLTKYKNNQFDIVYTGALSWVHKKDILVVLSEINRICKGIFIQYYITDDNSYKNRSIAWWHKQFAEAKMRSFPSSTRIALTTGA